MDKKLAKRPKLELDLEEDLPDFHVEEEAESSNEDQSDASGSDSDETEDGVDLHEKLRQRLLSMKPEKVAELKAKLGEELFKKTFAITEEKPDQIPQSSTSSPQISAKKKKKGSKRPREVSSKRPVSAFRKVVEVGKSKNFDPRFVAECGGDFDDITFRKDYGFLDDLRKKEIQELRKAHREAVRIGVQWKAERIKTNLLRLENQQKSAEAMRVKHELNAELRKANIERMNRGERPIYYNNQQMQNQFLTKKSKIRPDKRSAKRDETINSGA